MEIGGDGLRAGGAGRGPLVGVADGGGPPGVGGVLGPLAFSVELSPVLRAAVPGWRLARAAGRGPGIAGFAGAFFRVHTYTPLWIFPDSALFHFADFAPTCLCFENFSVWPG